MVSCSKELKLWIKEQKPKTVDELIEKAEAFQQAHKNEHVSKPDQPKHSGKSFQYKERQAETRTCFICQKAGHIATNCPSKPKKPAESGHKQGKFG